MRPTELAANGTRYSLQLTRLDRLSDHCKRRDDEAIEHVFRRVAELLGHMPPEELAETLTRAEVELSRVESRAAEADTFLALLPDAHRSTASEHAALVLANSVRAFARRRKLLEGSLGTVAVAKLLHTSRQTPHDRVRAGLLLAVLDRGQLRFPAWQFDAQGPDGVVAGLPSVVRTLHASPLGKMSWLQNPNPYLEGRTPLQALQEGEQERVLDAAHLVGES